MKISIIGAGPAGLFLATLLKRADAGRRVTVYEQNPKDATYGFGVTLIGHMIQSIETVDSPTYAALKPYFTWFSGQSVVLNGAEVKVDTPHISAGSIARVDLIRAMTAVAEGAGVDLRFNRPIPDTATFDPEADLIVGADGANSAVRAHLGNKLGTSKRQLGNRYCWYGADRAMERSTLNFRTRGEQAFVAHYYPYGDNLSTFVAECDAETWERHGFGDLSDDQRRVLIEDIYAEALDGATLLTSRSSWRRFAAVHNAAWSDGRYVLIGDALSPAHFSIGSGTRLALDDSIALAAAVDQQPGDVPAMLAAFREAREKERVKLARAAELSYEWYENFRGDMELAPLDFAYAYLTRTGRMPDERLRAVAPQFMANYAAHRDATHPTGAVAS